MNRTTVTTYGTLIATSLSLGFWAGHRAATRTEFSSVSKLRESSRAHKNSTTAIVSGEETDSESDDSDSNGPDNGDISTVRVDLSEECKMVFVIRSDLGMTSGKIAAQCSHAALACYKDLQSKNPTMLRQWEHTGQTKVALQCGSEDDLLLMQAQARSLNLCARSIQDAGRTQIAAGSRTVLGIAGPSHLVNQITGRLRLL